MTSMINSLLHMISLILPILSLTMVSSAAQNSSPLVIRSFNRMLLLEVQSVTSGSASIGDLNGDGFLDVAIAKGRHLPLFNRIFLNDGKGNFTASNLGDTPDRSYSVALADIDGDNRLDIVVSNDRPETKTLFNNKGNGIFNATGNFGDPQWNSRYVALADLNGDGFKDIAVANRFNPSYICRNNGTGAFPNCTSLLTESATIIVAVDFDGDSAIDLFVPHRDGGQSVMLWNDGKGGFASKAPLGRQR